MNLNGLLSESRSRLDDLKNEQHPEDNLWSDEELARYLDEAHEEAARRLECLFDTSTEDLAVIQVDAAVNSVPLNRKVLFVQKAFWNGKELHVGQLDQIDLYYRDWRTKQKTPEAYSVKNDILYLAWTPDVAGELRLEVCRLPLAPFDTAGNMTEQEPEIHSQYHLGLVDYVCSLAYLKSDEQTYDPNASARHLALFDRNFGPKRSFKHEQFKRNYMPKRARYPRL